MKAIVLSLALAVLAGGAQAQITGAQVLATFQEKGFTQIEVKSLGSTIKVQAVKGGMQVEVIYDTATGKIVKQETQPADAASGTDSSDDGVSDDTGSDDNGTDASDDGAGHDVGDDNGGDSEASDDGAGHDVGDDNGGNRTRSGKGGSGRHGGSDD